MEEIGLRNRLLSIKRELDENKSNRFATEMRVLDSYRARSLFWSPTTCTLIPFCRREVRFGITWLTATSTWTYFRRKKTDTIPDKQLGEVFDHPVPRKLHKSYLIERFIMEQS